MTGLPNDHSAVTDESFSPKSSHENESAEVPNVNEGDDYAKENIPMLPVTHGIQFTKLQIILYTIIMILVSILPFVVMMSGLFYLISALILGSIFLYYSFALYFDENNEHAKLSTSGLEIKDAGTTHATFAATTVIGETGTNESNIQITNSAIKLRQATTDIITLNNDGTITSTDYLIERSRLFGFGKDGTIVLTSSACTVSDGGNGAGSESVSDSQIKDANGTVVCSRTSSTWTMAGDWYTYDFTLSSGRLVTNGFRLFVFGTLTIASGAIISHNG